MPRTLTIRNLNAPVAERLLSYANKDNISVEVAVKDLLAIALGISSHRHKHKDNGLRKFRGTLSAKSADELLKNIEHAPFSQVDQMDV